MALFKSANHLVYQATSARGHRGSFEKANVDIIVEPFEGIEKKSVLNGNCGRLCNVLTSSSNIDEVWLFDNDTDLRNMLEDLDGSK